MYTHTKYTFKQFIQDELEKLEEGQSVDLNLTEVRPTHNRFDNVDYIRLLISKHARRTDKIFSTACSGEGISLSMNIERLPAKISFKSTNL